MMALPESGGCSPLARTPTRRHGGPIHGCERPIATRYKSNIESTTVRRVTFVARGIIAMPPWCWRAAEGRRRSGFISRWTAWQTREPTRGCPALLGGRPRIRSNHRLLSRGAL